MNRPNISMIRDDSPARGVMRFDGRSVHVSTADLELVDGYQVTRVVFDDVNGVLVFHATNGATVELEVRGAGFTVLDGIVNAGAPGARGPRGEPGVDGVNGQDGVRGPQGHAGPVGLDGRTGNPGPRGPKGVAGPEGDVGDKGDPGREGRFGKSGDPGRTGERGIMGQAGAVNVVISARPPQDAQDGLLWVEANPLRTS